MKHEKQHINNNENTCFQINMNIKSNKIKQNKHIKKMKTIQAIKHNYKNMKPNQTKTNIMNKKTQ